MAGPVDDNQWKPLPSSCWIPSAEQILHTTSYLPSLKFHIEPHQDLLLCHPSPQASLWSQVYMEGMLHEIPCHGNWRICETEVHTIDYWQKNVIMTSAWHCNCRCCRLFIILKKKILQRRCRTHQLHAVRHIISISNYYGLKKYRYYLTEGCADPSSERNIEKNCTRDVDVYNVLKCISTNHSARQLDM